MFAVVIPPLHISNKYIKKDHGTYSHFFNVDLENYIYTLLTLSPLLSLNNSQDTFLVRICVGFTFEKPFAILSNFHPNSVSGDK